MAAPVSPRDEGDMVWPPDSRLLFFVDRDGHIDILDVKASKIGDLGVVLPPITQLALRVGAAK